jgi:TonB family protein
MEKYQEKKYLIVWLYISIILHLIVGIIMITLKPLDPFAKEPDPAKTNDDVIAAQIIFVEEQQPQKLEFADRTQAFVQGNNQETGPEENNPDYTTGLQNQTKEAINMDQKGAEDTTLPDNPQLVQPAAKTVINDTIKKFAAEEKPVSKKYRPITEKGQENLSKLELLEPKANLPIASKKKFTLQDLKNGFASFTSAGDNYYLSSKNGSQKDTELGLKQLSYMNQIGKIYQNAFKFINNQLTKDEQPPKYDSIIEISIDRSGKVTPRIIQKSDNHQFDTQHMQAIRAMGQLPPIPQYLDAPLVITTSYYFNKPNNKFGASFIQKNF